MDDFRSFGICPDIIDNPPFQLLEVKWIDSNLSANKGSIFTPEQMKNQPLHVRWLAQKDAFYTLLMVDPDVPCRKQPDDREWLHWMVVNIPNLNISEGEVKVEYIGPCPPENTGLHRYVFLVFKQVAKQDYSDVHHISNTTCNGRAKFSTRSFAKKHRLHQLVASNFVQAEWNINVSEMYRNLYNNKEYNVVKTKINDFISYLPVLVKK